MAYRRFSAGLAFTPDGEHVLFVSNLSGQFNLWRVPAEGGWPGQLTAFTDDTVRLMGVSSQDATIAFCADHDGDEFHQIYLLEPGRGWPEKITEAPEVPPHEEDGMYLPGPWAADGSGFYLLSDEGREFRGLAFYDVDTGSWDWVETPEADVEEVGISRDGRVLAWLVNENGWDMLKLRDLQTGRDLPHPDLPRGARPHLTGFQPPLAVSADGAHVAVILSGPRRPGEVWVVDTESGESHAVTESRIGGLREDDLVDVELISYPSFDGRQIPAWLYRPEADGKVPV